MKNYNIVLNGIYFFDKSVKTNDKTYESITEITNGNNNLTVFLSDYLYFNERFNLTVVDLNTDSKIIQHINFIGTPDRDKGATAILFLKNLKKLYGILHLSLKII